MTKSPLSNISIEFKIDQEYLGKSKAEFEAYLKKNSLRVKKKECP
ncbi:hypothetical protein [Virgibacillus pantothenticus]|nr:hypothetical protein [Virgibacillus pantothenticus]